MTYIKNKRLGLLCLGMAIFISLTGCTANSNTEVSEVSSEAVTVEIGETETTDTAEQLKALSVKSEKIKEETDAYIVEVELPIITGFEDHALETSINESVKEAATDYVEAIKKTALEIQSEGYLTTPYYAGIAYEVLNDNENYLSIEITYNEYTGGAHGNYFSEYINYDVQSEKILSLSDIVDTDKPYMEVLNEVILEAVEEARANSEYGEGLHSWYEGVEEETLSFSIEEEGLGIHFQPYEIGSYAEGAPSFMIPYDKISDIIMLK